MLFLTSELANKAEITILYVCMYVYVIGHSPSGLFRTNVNKW